MRRGEPPERPKTLELIEWEAKQKIALEELRMTTAIERDAARHKETTGICIIVGISAVLSLLAVAAINYHPYFSDSEIEAPPEQVALVDALRVVVDLWEGTAEGHTYLISSTDPGTITVEQIEPGFLRYVESFKEVLAKEAEREYLRENQ